MIPELLILGGVLVVGLTVARWLDREVSGARLLAEAFLYGCGLASVALLLLAYARIRWSLPALVLVCGGISFAALLASRHADARPREADESRTRGSIVSHFIDGATALIVIGYVFFALIARPWEWDFWAIWGLKARTFFDAGGIDWRMLGDQWMTFTHPDYPPLFPLAMDVLALGRGEWNDRWMGLLSVAFGLAALLALRGHLRGETDDGRVVALGTLAATGLALGSRVALADIPLTAFVTAGALLVRRGLVTGAHRQVTAGGVLLGLAALTKNEGLAVLVAVAIAVLATAPANRAGALVRLWPAFALTALWQAPRLVLGFGTDLFAGDALSRLLDLERLIQVARRLFHPLPPHPIFWLAAAVALVLGGAVALGRERFLVTVVGLQLLFDLASYAATANAIEWQVANSWERVLLQVSLLALFIGMACVAPRLRTAVSLKSERAG